MAKKTTAAKTPATSKMTKSRAVEPDVATKAKPVKETKARASAVPPTKAKSAKPTATTTDITSDMIAEKAYHLWLAGHPGGEHDHWIAAERELRGQ
jgi:hypothetical protein